MGTPSNQSVVQACYESFGKGDIDAILSRLADDVVWEGPDAPDLPYSGTFKGKSDVKRFFAGVGQVDVNLFEPKEYLNIGNTVVVLGRWGGKARPTGKSFVSKWPMVWEFADGKVKRFREFLDSASAAEAFPNNNRSADSLACLFPFARRKPKARMNPEGSCGI